MIKLISQERAQQIHFIPAGKSCLFLECQNKQMSQQSGTQQIRVRASTWISKNSIGSRCQYGSLLDLETDV